MCLLERLSESNSGVRLSDLADRLAVDERTVRRDLDALQGLLDSVGAIQLDRGTVRAMPGVFARVLPGGARSGSEASSKVAMSEAAVRRIPEGSAVVLTAGTSTLAVAARLRSCQVNQTPPNNLIVFTNSLPALLELVAGGVSTGVIGEVYNPMDCAFHSQELRTRFQASHAIVGASGIILDTKAGSVNLCSDRMEEAAFMRQLLAPIPEILVVAEAGKIGRRHPWSFTSEGLLAGKTVHLITTSLQRAQTDALAGLAEAARRSGITLTFEETATCAA